MILFTALLLCTLSVGMFASCSNMSAKTDQQNQVNNSLYKPKKELEKAPPMVMQQFGGCKAHQ